MVERKIKNDRKMTYEAVSLKLWESEGKKGKPLSKQAIQKIERRAMEKVKTELAKSGLTEQDVMEYFASLGSTVEMGVGE